MKYNWCRFLWFGCIVVSGFHGPQLLTNHRRFREPSCGGSSNGDKFEENNKQVAGFNPLKELSDMFNSFDDVIDDFMNKRMGNGEVFYGKRKYRPSGKANTEGRYNGMGLSDKGRIDAARQIKEDFQARRAWERQQQGHNSQK